VANSDSDDVSVIDTSTNTVVATFGVGNSPLGVAVRPGGGKVYVANAHSNNVSGIATFSNTVGVTVGVGSIPFGVEITPDGGRVYVANGWSDDVSVIDTSTNKVVATIDGVGDAPRAFGKFIWTFGKAKAGYSPQPHAK
jgi:YVTN family beta-propeller protein